VARIVSGRTIKLSLHAQPPATILCEEEVPEKEQEELKELIDKGLWIA
jgi:hypothetical protein